MTPIPGDPHLRRPPSPATPTSLTLHVSDQQKQRNLQGPATTTPPAPLPTTKEVEQIANAHVFGTQESVENVNSYPCYMGQFMLPNMMPHNMRPTIAQGGAILPFSPSMAQGGAILPNMAQGGTGAGFDQFFNFPTSQSNMSSLFNSEVWRGQSSITSSQVWRGEQSRLMESQGQGSRGGKISFTEMLNARDNDKK